MFNERKDEIGILDRNEAKKVICARKFSTGMREHGIKPITLHKQLGDRDIHRLLSQSMAVCEQRAFTFLFSYMPAAKV